MGRNGIYATGGESSSLYLRDYWKAWKQDAIRQDFPSQSAAMGHASLQICANGFPWCHPNGTYLTPPTCSVNSSACRALFHMIPSYATAQIEQILRNLKLKITTVYAGLAEHAKLLEDYSAKNKYGLFYAYFPSWTSAALNMTRVHMPTTKDSQYSATTNPNLTDPSGRHRHCTITAPSLHRHCTIADPASRRICPRIR